MREPTRDASTYQRRFWNTGFERLQAKDRKRRRELRHRWREYLHEKKKEYNTTGEAHH